MAVRANPRLIDELEHFGAQDVSKCYHCGNCSAACKFSQDPFIFPRRTLRYLQMGLETRLRSAYGPWLCYYCGDCTQQCPRGAEPGETMMSLRRWLTSQYDFTGIARLFYRSWKIQFAVMLVLALVTGAGLLAYGFTYGGGSLSIYDGEKAFLPPSAIHNFDWAMGGILFALLFINCIRMWRFMMRGELSLPVSLGAYIRSAFVLPYQFLLQKRFRDCDNKRPWTNHFPIMAGYATMLVLIVFFLHHMQEGPEVRWMAHTFGYLASIALVTGLTLAFRGRLKKEDPYHHYTHPSDWIFLGGLVFVVITGIVQHILHRAGLPMAANIAYVVHLMGVVSFEVTQVPFGKWSHMAYRPLGLYFAKMQQEAYAKGLVPIGRAANPQHTAVGTEAEPQPVS